jgi:hypothetical protein
VREEPIRAGREVGSTVYSRALSTVPGSPPGLR